MGNSNEFQKSLQQQTTTTPQDPIENTQDQSIAKNDLISTKKPSHSSVSFYDFFYSNKQKKTYVNLIAGIILIIVFILFALRPTITTIGEIQAKTEEYEGINEQLEKKLTNARQLIDQLTLTLSQGGQKESIEYLNQLLVEDVQLNLIVTNIYERAKDNNVAISTLDITYPDEGDFGFRSDDDTDLSVAPTSKLFSINYTFESADFSDMIDFIGELEGYETFPIFSRMLNISITDNEKSQELQEATTEEDSDLDENEEEVIPLTTTTANIQMLFYLYDGSTGTSDFGDVTGDEFTEDDF